MEKMKQQKAIIDEVFYEMEMAEEFVSQWKASWSEKLSKILCEDLEHIDEKEYVNLKSKYGDSVEFPQIDEPSFTEGLPLRKKTLVSDDGRTYNCEFREIDWNSMNSSKSERTFTFSNNGDITFSKGSKFKGTDSSRRNKKTTKKPTRKISYDTKFNVSSSDFTIEIVTKDIKPRNMKPGCYETTIDKYSISLIGTLLIKKCNDIQIMEDLSTGIKVIQIAKKHDKNDRRSNASVVFEAKLNADNSLEVGAVAISTYKGNGKVNGNYRFDVSREKGVRANFYSRKGKRIDLIANPLLLQNANNLLTSKEDINTSNQIVKEFTESTENAITKNLPQEIELSEEIAIVENIPEETATANNKSERTINFDATDFNMIAVTEADRKIMDLLKCIKGEMPLVGLRNRIDHCFELINKPKVEVIEERPKMLALEATIE